MKALILALAATVMVAAVPASAQPDPRDHRGAQYDHRGNGEHRDNGDHRDNSDRRDNGDRHDNGRHRGWGHDYNGGDHQWRRGERMGYNDWRSYQRVDYRQHHLRRPPHGYEWRQSSNGNYILAAVASGLIASIIMDAGR